MKMMIVPLGHTQHCCDPWLGLYSPLLHGVQVVLPSNVLIVPGAHWVQLLAASDDDDVPNGHFWQAVDCHWPNDVVDNDVNNDDVHDIDDVDNAYLG